MITRTMPHRPSDAARFDDAARRRVAVARSRLLGGAGEIEGETAVSPEILSSWRRSLELGVDPDHAGVPAPSPRNERSRRLVDAAAPVLSALADQCRDADVWGMLLDRDCIQLTPIVGDERVVREGLERGGGVGASFHEAFVGTNGAGISLERLEAFLVVGEEHFRTSEHSLASVGAPLRDPLGRMVGFILICQRVSSANHLIVPYTQSLALSIEEQLAKATDADDRALFAAFSKHSRRPSLPVVGLNDQVFLANNAAQQVLREPADVDALRHALLDVVRGGRSRLIAIEVGGVRYRVHSRVIEIGGGRQGAVASLSRVAEPRPTPVARLLESPTDPLVRAQRMGLPALVQGERGSGRAHRVHQLGEIAQLDALAAAADPAGWLERLRAVTAAGPVLVRHLDELADVRGAALEILGLSRHWVCATAATSAPGFDGLFPVTVEVRPLRERSAELPRIVDALIAGLGAGGVRCSPEVMSILSRHAWPGNITQLRRVLASGLVHREGATITIRDLPREVADGGRAYRDEGLLARTERELVFDALRAANWNRDEAAQQLGISRATMYRRIRQFGFQVPSSR